MIIMLMLFDTRHIPVALEVDLGALAQATPGMSGADLANLANEAALTAARKGRSVVTPVDFEGAQYDLQAATRPARAMVTQLGRADELGPT